MDARLREQLAAVLDARALGSAEVVAPARVEDVAAACRVLAEAGARFAVRSAAPRRGATRSDLVLLSLHRLDGVEVEPARLVARAGAGATLGALRAAADAHGLVLAAAVATATPAALSVGALIGEGRLPRRGLTGVEAVLPGGEVVRAGGAMLKDVAGYDLAAVLLGSGGRLAAVTTAWFRLQPSGTPIEAGEAGLRRSGRGATAELVRRAFDPAGLLAGG